MLQNVEALREVKRAEEAVRQRKEEAAREAGEIVRKAERDATALIEQAKTEAEDAYRQGIQSAEEQAKSQRVDVLKKGDAEAAAVRDKASGPDFEKAVDLIIKNFSSRATGQ